MENKLRENLTKTLAKPIIIVYNRKKRITPNRIRIIGHIDIPDD